MNKLSVALLIALFMLPASAAMIHLHVHGDIIWLLYLALFDAFIITAMFLHDKTRIYGFWLNTLIGLAGIIYHADFNFMGTLADSMIIVSDIMIGYALLTVMSKKPLRRKK